MALVMGINKANSIYACVWCTVSKEKRYYTDNNTYCTSAQEVHAQGIYWIVWLHRWDTSVPEAQYNTPPPEGMMRTLASLQLNSTYSKPGKHLGSKNPLLLQLEPSQYMIDELHLLLRVSNVLMRNMVHLANQLDHERKIQQGMRGTHIQRLEKLVQSCGVHFHISPVGNQLLQGMHN